MTDPSKTDFQGKAWTYTSTTGGVVENLSLASYTVEHSKKDHILIEVLSTSLNPGDYKFPLVPLVGRFITKPASVCWDFCGRVRSLPDGYTGDGDTRNLAVGQIVWGMHRDLKTIGTLKTIMWVHVDSVYPLPEVVPVHHGAALGVAAMTAYQAVAQGAGSKVLIVGGAGGVGTFAIQVAKALDMFVYATCSEAGMKLCKELGADEVLDYKSESFHDRLAELEVDLVVDLVGDDPGLHARSEQFLKADGEFILVGLMDRDWAGIRSMLVSWLCPAWLGGPSRKWRVLFTQNKISDYEAVAALARDGKIKVVVDSEFAFEDALKAFARLQSGRAKGKILVRTGDL